MTKKLFEVSLQTKLKVIPESLLMSYESLIDPEVRCLLVMAKAWSESQHRMSLSERSGLSQIPWTSPAVQSLAQKGLKGVGLMLLVTPTPSAKLPQDT